MKLTLIDEWQKAWRFASVWVSGVGFSVLTVWTLMPPAVRDVVPDPVEILVGGLLFGAVFLARVTAQPKLKGKCDDAE